MHCITQNSTANNIQLIYLYNCTKHANCQYSEWCPNEANNAHCIRFGLQLLCHLLIHKYFTIIIDYQYSNFNLKTASKVKDIKNLFLVYIYIYVIIAIVCNGHHHVLF